MTKDEISIYLEMLQRLDNWECVRDFALNLYGPDSHRIEIETGSEYDDEGGYYTTLENVTAYDKEDNSLEFDLSTKWWQTERWFVHSSDDTRTCVEYLQDQVREAAIELLDVEEEHRLMLEEAWDNRLDLFDTFDLPRHQDRDDNIYTLDQPLLSEQLPQVYTPCQWPQKKLTFFVLLLVSSFMVIGYQSIIGLLKRISHQSKPGDR